MTTYLTPRQIADDPRLPVFNRDSIYQALISGQLRGSKVKGRWVTTWEAVEEWIEAGSNSVRRRKNRGAA